MSSIDRLIIITLLLALSVEPPVSVNLCDSSVTFLAPWIVIAVGSNVVGLTGSLNIKVSVLTLRSSINPIRQGGSVSSTSCVTILPITLLEVVSGFPELSAINMESTQA